MKIYKFLFTDIFFLLGILLVIATAFSGDFEKSPEEVTFISEPVAVTKSSKVYIIEDDTILVHNKYNTSVQCFDFDGNFLWGMLLPSTKNIDTTKVSYQDGKLIVHDGKNHLVYFFDDFNLVGTEINSSLNTAGFYKIYPFEKSGKYNCRLSLKTEVLIKDITGNIVKTVPLKTKVYPWSYTYSRIGFIILVALYFCFSRIYKLPKPLYERNEE